MEFNTESAFAERDMQRVSHYLVQKRSFAQRYTRSIQTLGAKNTNLRTTGVVQACHNFLISEKRNNKTVKRLKKEPQQSFLVTCIQVGLS